MTKEELIKQYTNKEGKFDLIQALLDQGQAIEDRDLIIGKQEKRIRDLEDGMSYFANEWTLRFGGIIIPTTNEINEFKK